jgi:hypothetical protein
MITLQLREGQRTPNAVTENGSVISTPIYLSPTVADRKALLNAFREVKRQQLLELGYNPQPASASGIQVIDNTKAPVTPIELKIVPEEQLRLLLFQRSGIPEKFLLKLQQEVGLEIIKKDDMLAAATAWINYLTNNEPDPTPTTKTANRRSKAHS